MDTIVQLVNQMGFPIAMSVMSFYLLFTQQKTNQATLDKITETHQQESAKWVEALNNNTRAIEMLCERVRVMDDAT